MVGTWGCPSGKECPTERVKCGKMMIRRGAVGIERGVKLTRRFRLFSKFSRALGKCSQTEYRVCDLRES